MQAIYNLLQDLECQQKAKIQHNRDLKANIFYHLILQNSIIIFQEKIKIFRFPKEENVLEKFY
jgi:hypothetical protein